MKEEKYFMIDQLPEQLSELENRKMLRCMKGGKVDNQEFIVLHNLNLVKLVVDNYDTDYDKEELFQMGVIELINSINTFNCKERKSFARYAMRNIKNKITEVLNSLTSDDRTINYGHITDIENNKLINTEYIIDENIDIEASYERKELGNEMKTYINNLPQISREPLKMYFGFYGKCYSFEEIGQIFDVSKSFIRSVIASELRTIRKLIATKKMDEIVKNLQKRK